MIVLNLKAWFAAEFVFALSLIVPYFVFLLWEGLDRVKALKKIALGLGIYIFVRLIFMLSIIDAVREINKIKGF